MGRKANKKRARAARPPSQAQNTSAGTTTATIRSLKGIISSNDDPYSCHGCSEKFDLNDIMVGAHDWRRTSTCCGKMFCCTCTAAGKGTPFVGAACSSCGVSTTRKLSKARAKEGHPWAQFALAWQLQRESLVEARKWYRKAAEEGGHPLAFAYLSNLCRQGLGGSGPDPEKAREFVKKGIEILFLMDGGLSPAESVFAPRCLAGLVTFANLAGIKTVNRLDLIELFALIAELAKKGLRGGAYVLVVDHLLKREDSVALDLARKAAVQAGAPPLSPGVPARLAADCCQMLGRIVEGLFWAKQAALAGGWTKNEKEHAETAHSDLCEMRKSCSTCGISLNSSNRKLCAGCKISCYCSRDCQKMHWNRPDDGHRDECKTIMKMVEEMEKNKGKTE